MIDLTLKWSKLVEAQIFFMNLKQGLEKYELRRLNFEILSDPLELLTCWQPFHKLLCLPLRQRISLCHLKVEIEEFKNLNSDFEAYTLIMSVGKFWRACQCLDSCLVDRS